MGGVPEESRVRPPPGLFCHTSQLTVRNNLSLVQKHRAGRMIVGIGTDLAEVSRIRDAIARYGERFIARIYTQRERSYAASKANVAERFAARFAAKEAGMKALGTGWNFGVKWQDFEVMNEPSGRPKLILHGIAEQIARKLGAERVSISLTHTSETAFAIVILESSDDRR